jgi:two-component system, OmpR family, sensor histidine kinase MprB
MSIRARLALGAAAAVAIAIVLASVVVYFLVRNELRAQVDRSLQSEAHSIAQIPLSFSTYAYPPNVYSFDVPSSLFTGYFQIVGDDGKIYIPAGYLSPSPLLPVNAGVRAVAAGQSNGYFYDRQLQGQDTRVYTMYSDRFQPVAIQVVAQLSTIDNELARIRLWLLLVSVGGIALASGAGLLVARTTLRPVRELSETAERVRKTRDLSQRIEADGTDELATLARTFNAMLESLDEAAQRQRRLVQDASHELRTPLTSLRTNIEVLASGGRMPATERKQLLQDVVVQLGEMTELIGELTELARGEEQNELLEEVRLDLLTGEAIRRATRHHPDVSFQADLATTTVVGRPASLERAITNLLDNAAKWSPAGSPIEVRLADGELTVRDHGPGIASEDVPHVFERFYRATSARGMPGSGLGLAIVKQVAESHSGTIAVESPEDGGTLMRLRIGKANGASARPSAPSA